MKALAAAALLVVIALASLPPVGAQGAAVPGYVAIVAGSETTCATTTGGRLQCWGYGIFGSLGDGLRRTSLRPTPVAGLTDVASVAVRDLRACAVTTGHDVWCWGYNVHNEPRNRTITAAPVRLELEGLGGAVASIALSGHTCVLTVAEAVRCWGANYY